jgi:hypothetical protein
LHTKLKTYKSKIIIIGKNWSQEDSSKKLEKEPLKDYETACCSPLAHMVLQKIFKDLAIFLGFWPMFDLKKGQGQIS